MRTVIVIPARYGSSRYLGKPLIPLLGKPMILWVAELSARALSNENVYVATDDRRIADIVENAGFRAIMTASNCLTGTDRIAEAACQIKADIYINVQGDEPLVDPLDIINVRNAKLNNMNAIVNGFSWITPLEDPQNINIPKVVTNELNELLYISRAAIPGFKDTECAPDLYKKQICIYAFTGEELAAFRDFGRKSTLEIIEDIEILRFLELGKTIQMVETKPGSLAVDIPEDVPKVEMALQIAGYTDK